MTDFGMGATSSTSAPAGGSCGRPRLCADTGTYVSARACPYLGPDTSTLTL
jgi:hypothetical protein